ncbi:MAG: type II toxin-antitoxin system RelE/ParE family toxin [Terracidiphilus sp.]
MQFLKTRWFARFARHERLTDVSLQEAIERAERGLIDADLGGGLIKLRVARQGQGRSGGYRVIVAYRTMSRAVFLFGFAKSKRENISSDELVLLRELAKNWITADAATIYKEIETGNILEIEND